VIRKSHAADVQYTISTYRGIGTRQRRSEVAFHNRPKQWNIPKVRRATMALSERNKAQAAELKRRSLAGLSGLNFFVADMLTGFGPFVTVYLI
jgi:hypothetical protein